MSILKTRFKSLAAAACEAVQLRSAAARTFFWARALAPDLVGQAQAAVVVQVFWERFVFDV
jgi:hypothetical protein